MTAKKNRAAIKNKLMLIQSAQNKCKKEQAREHAEKLIHDYPKIEEVWLILAYLSDPRQALLYLEQALPVNLSSQSAWQGIRLTTSQMINSRHGQGKVKEGSQPIYTKDGVAEATAEQPEGTS